MILALSILTQYHIAILQFHFWLIYFKEDNVSDNEETSESILSSNEVAIWLELTFNNYVFSKCENILYNNMIFIILKF